MEIKIAYDLISNGKVEALLGFIAAWIFVWLFKEFRSKYLKEQEYKASFLSENIENYSFLILEIKRYIDDRSIENKRALEEKIARAYSTMPSNLFNEFKDLKIVTSDLKKMKIRLEEELSHYKFLKDQIVFFETKGAINTVERIGNQFKSILFPVMLTVYFFLLFIVVIALFSYIIQLKHDFVGVLTAIMFFINMFALAILVLSTLDLIGEKRYKFGWVNIIINIIYLILIVLFLIFVFKYKFFTNLCFIVFTALYILYSHKKMIKRMN